VDRLTYLMQGEFRVSRDPDEQFSTILGSCVAVCLWDKSVGAGGMNHFLLPGGSEGKSQDGSLRYGINSMEMLINGLLKIGARRNELEAKIFGGARISSNLRDVGASNAAFARSFLADEGIPCRGESLGGTSARRVIFRPATGQAKQLLVPDNAIAPTRQSAIPVAKPADASAFLF
jgi:chemotaxis protein CheD